MIDRAEIYSIRLEKILNFKQSNCIGTALFLAGLTLQDEFYSPTHVYNDFLIRLTVLSSPTPFCLVAWHKVNSRNIETPHMGIITDSEGKTMTHRACTKCTVTINERFEYINARYPQCNVVYYSPGD